MVAGFVLDATFPLECVSNKTVIDDSASETVKFFCALSVFVLEFV